MKFKLFMCTACAAFSGMAHADLYRMVLSSELTNVEDLRTSNSDPFADTAWDVDVFTPVVGDVWSYEVIFDTDISPEDFKDGEHAIWASAFASTFTVAGQTTQGFDSSFFLYLVDQNVNNIHQTSEIWGENSLGLGIFTGFNNWDQIGELINNGEVVTSSDAFDGDIWSGLYVAHADGSLVLQTDAATPYTITVTQIPAPSTLLLIGIAAAGARVRRSR